jgi:MarR family transcriptional regulator, organic hydroperoxide resistance regulator
MQSEPESADAATASVEDWELLAQVAQAYRSLSDTFMDQIGMHRAQATLLCRLFDHDGMTQSEIAEQLSVQGATVTNMLQRMEEAGLVTRRRDPEDNRLVRVYLTDTGRRQERAITEQFMKVEEAIFDGLGPQDRTVLRRVLKQMLRNMNAES